MKIRNFIILAFFTYLATGGCKKEGPEGKKALLDLIIEPQGLNCTSGGYKVISGIDLNNNNILDTSEIQSTKYICNGNNGNNSLLSVIPEPVGTNCSAGGYKVVSGIDLNGNNILDVSEVQKTVYICDGVAGNNSLLNVIPESAGTNCSSGGFKVISGVDLNNNNILDENEIRNTEYICNGNDGGYDKVIRFDFWESNYSWVTNSEKILQDSIMHINLANYSKIDSISFEANIYSSSASVYCELELINLQNNQVINGSKLSTNSTKWVWVRTQTNFLSNMPTGEISLGLKLKPSTNGTNVSLRNAVLNLYRK